MGAIKSSEIRRPRRGQPVWMIVNGEPALRYFVEFKDRSACVVAFAPDLKDQYYDDLACFFKSETSILANFIASTLERIQSAAEELEGYHRRLVELGTAVVCADCWTVTEKEALVSRKRACFCPGCGSRLCRRCGCTEAAACEGGCWWSEADAGVCDSHEGEQ